MTKLTNYLYAFVAGLTFGSLVAAQELIIEGDVTTKEVERTVIVKEPIKVVQKLPCTVKAPPGAFDYRWEYPASITAKKDEDAGTLQITAAPSGIVVVSCKIISFDANNRPSKKTVELRFAIGEPTPQPKPVDPPSPAPIPLDGFRVMMIYEQMQLTPEISNIINSKPYRDYLNSHCAISPDGKTREWGNFDKDENMSKFPTHWAEAMKRPRSSLPWLIISNGKAGWEGPLPDTLDKTLAKFKEYGGQ